MDPGRKGELFWLYAEHASQLVVPLITLPYIVRVVGPSRYGMIAFAAAVVQILAVVIDYGYQFSAPRQVIARRDDKAELSLYLWSVVWTRMTLFALAGVVLVGLCLLVDAFAVHASVLAVTFLMLPGTVLFPLFAFQGMGKLREYSMVAMTARLSALVLILVLVNNAADYLRVPAIYAGTQMLAGVTATFFLLPRWGVVSRFPDAAAIVKSLSESFRTFLTSSAINAYVSVNTVLMGMFAPGASTGFYAAAERATRLSQGLLNPLRTSYFARVPEAAGESASAGLEQVRKAARLLIPASCLISLTLFLTARPLTLVLLGEEFQESVRILRILSPLPFLTSVTFIAADLRLLGFGRTRTWSRVIAAGALFHLVLAPALIVYLDSPAVAVAAALLATETLVMILSLASSRRPLARDAESVGRI